MRNMACPTCSCQTERHNIARPCLSCATKDVEIGRLKSFVAETLPFLEEAWAACFHGQKKRLLSAEERGMGHLIQFFRAIAEGRPALPPGLITIEEHGRLLTAATKHYHDLLGDPNSPEAGSVRERWMMIGDTCLDGLKRADTEVERLRQQLAIICQRRTGALLSGDGPESPRE